MDGDRLEPTRRHDALTLSRFGAVLLCLSVSAVTVFR